MYTYIHLFRHIGYSTTFTQQHLTFDLLTCTLLQDTSHPLKLLINLILRCSLSNTSYQAYNIVFTKFPQYNIHKHHQKTTCAWNRNWALHILQELTLEGPKAHIHNLQASRPSLEVKMLIFICLKFALVYVENKIELT